MSSAKVSVVLNYYRRPHSIKKQFEAIKAQTVQPEEILIWQNKGDMPDFMPLNPDIQSSCATAVSNKNWGVWSRFSYALNAKSDFICMFDDDTIPGPLWLENCIKTYEEERAVLGTIGVIFNDLDYMSYDRWGWANPNEKKEKVDIVGHSWFFDRETLGCFWRDAEVPLHDLSGEDIHLSYAAKKHLDINTYVPKHPKDCPDMWGSNPGDANILGVDRVAISVNYHGTTFGQNLKHYNKKGFNWINNL